jgi:hypothetical protein
MKTKKKFVLGDENSNYHNILVYFKRGVQNDVTPLGEVRGTAAKVK